MVHAEKPSGSPSAGGSLPTCVAPSGTVAEGTRFGECSPPPSPGQLFSILQPPLNLPLAPTNERDPGKLSALQMFFFFLFLFFFFFFLTPFSSGREG